jgi:SpoVK/Ycf46/Vps4 family AAA+-type ATPase
LSNHKTFDSLYFKEKEGLLALIDHFIAKTGKYSIPVYPHKLGLLLYRPPGTGKTSLIKALGQYTGRSIVNIPLTRVATNSELTSVYFDQKYAVDEREVQRAG